MQTHLFDRPSNSIPPLAHRIRPSNLKHFYGQEEAFHNYPFLLKGTRLPSCIFWGPCGCGKTTLAKLLTQHHQLEFYPFQAVLSGVGELKKLISRAQDIHGSSFVIFIDEIHRFNKSQQDALLPHVEEGRFTLLGATTENPRTSIIRALLSRMQIVALKALKEASVRSILKRALKELKWECPEDILALLSIYYGGDARKALNALELLAEHFQDSAPEYDQALFLIQSNARYHDKSGDRHYDVISAFIKSIRGSDPDAALLWLAVMLDGGEEPLFIARRLVILASEDIGNADPGALGLATSALQAVEKIGLPEARIILAQATTYLSQAKKSNASYLGIERALAYVRQHPNIEVPTHLRNHHPDKKRYLYPHDYPSQKIRQDYAPTKVKFYDPKNNG